MAKYKIIYNETEVVTVLGYDTIVADENGQDILNQLEQVLTKVLDDKKAIKSKADGENLAQYVLDQLALVKQDVDDKTNITYTQLDVFIGTPSQAKKWFDQEGIDYSNFTEIFE